MPIYEYVCQNCKEEFEAIRPISQKDAAIVCEKCGSEDVKRQLAVFYAHSGGSASPATSGGGGGCASCSGGDCSHCGH
jgi:putative FmdB family regulatory protein